MLSYLKLYRDSWLTAVGSRAHRQRLGLDLFACILMQAVALLLYGQRMEDLICEKHLQLQSETSSDWQPCSTSNPVLRTASMVLSFRSSLTALMKDTHPSGVMPTELVLLALHASATLTMFLITIFPSFWLQHRSYILMLTSVACNAAGMSSLLSHPHSKPSQHWSTWLPNAGAGVVWQQCMFRVRLAKL